MATIKETLEACQIVVNALAVGQGGLSYHPANMVELSNHIAVALEEVSRLTPRALDGASALCPHGRPYNELCEPCGRVPDPSPRQ